MAHATDRRWTIALRDADAGYRPTCRCAPVVVGFPALSPPRPRAAPKLIATLIGPEQDPGVGLDLIGRWRAASRPL